MSVRRNTSGVKSGPTTYRIASYTPCEHCGEGAMVWDDDEGASVCNCCGALYTGRK